MTIRAAPKAWSHFSACSAPPRESIFELAGIGLRSSHAVARGCAPLVQHGICGDGGVQPCAPYIRQVKGVVLGSARAVRRDVRCGGLRLTARRQA
jgi:hypothetical protein